LSQVSYGIIPGMQAEHESRVTMTMMTFSTIHWLNLR